jgi:hypothetical protein
MAFSCGIDLDIRYNQVTLILISQETDEVIRHDRNKEWEGRYFYFPIE